MFLAPFLLIIALSSSPTTFTQYCRKITAINAFETLVLTYILGSIFFSVLFLMELIIYNQGFSRHLRDLEKLWRFKSKRKKEKRSYFFR